MKNKYLLFITSILIAFLTSCNNSEVIKTLIITGQGEHNWMVSSEAVKQILDETSLFSSKVILTPPKGEDMSGFNPKFSRYKLVVIDYEGDAWPEMTTAALQEYVKNGGGLVLFNTKSDMISTAADSIAPSGNNNFEIRTQVSDHPVTKDLPVRWLHPCDMITRGMKLAAEDVLVLASAFPGASFSRNRGMVPVLLARNYEKGRIFVTMIGTPDETESQALHCSGFIVTLQRGAEWAAKGTVTQEVPFDFPTAAGVVLRPDFKAVTTGEAVKMLGNYDIAKSTKYFTYLQSQIRKAAGDEVTLMMIEKAFVTVLKNPETTPDAKKLILRELSWMGTGYSIPAIKDLENVPELKDDVNYALTRLQVNN